MFSLYDDETSCKKSEKFNASMLLYLHAKKIRKLSWIEIFN